MPKKSLRNLDLNLMVVFEAIYASGNISHASKHLALSQPAVSNALARLRTLMEDPLFVRTKTGVAATPKARRMIGPVRDALKLLGAQIDSGEPDFATYERHFRIVISDPIEAVTMPAVVNALAAKMPKVTLECLSGFRADFVNELVEGTADLACYIYPTPTPDLVTVPITPFDVVVVTRRGHPAFRKKITAEAYLKLRHIMLSPDLRNKIHVEQSMAAQGALRRPMYTVNKLWSFPFMIERTDLVATLPRWFAQEVQKNFALDIHPSPVPVAEQHIYMTWHVRDNDDPGHKWLREAMLAAFPRGGKSA